MKKYFSPPCPTCGGEMGEIDECLKCESCGEEQSFSYMESITIHERMTVEEARKRYPSSKALDRVIDEMIKEEQK